MVGKRPSYTPHQKWLNKLNKVTKCWHSTYYYEHWESKILWNPEADNVNAENASNSTVGLRIEACAKREKQRGIFVKITNLE